MFAGRGDARCSCAPPQRRESNQRRDLGAQDLVVGHGRTASPDVLRDLVAHPLELRLHRLNVLAVVEERDEQAPSALGVAEIQVALHAGRRLSAVEPPLSLLASPFEVSTLERRNTCVHHSPPSVAAAKLYPAAFHNKQLAFGMLRSCKSRLS